MDKRYQIFISSTFADLQKERKSVMEAILSLDCFPAGMEMFPASDDEQFEYIKTIIDESDYYVLIIAGRYGTISDDGKSYTQKEYEYAKEKGIPILTFVRNNIDNIPIKNTDQDTKKSKKLKEFIEITTSNKLARYWDDYKDLKYEVHTTLNKAFKTHPQKGWIKGDIDNKLLLQQLNSVRIANDELSEKLKKQEIQYNELRDKIDKQPINLNEINIDQDLKVTYFDNRDRVIKTTNIDYKNFFINLAELAYDGLFTMEDFNDSVESEIKSIINLDYNDFDATIRTTLKLRIKLERDGLFSVSEDGYFFNITKTGMKLFENIIIQDN